MLTSDSMAESTDATLLDAWRAGDAKAGGELFARHFESIFRFFRNKVAGDIEDLVQQTFLACVEGRDRFRDDASFRTYLFSIARRRLHRSYRRAYRAARTIDFGVSSVWDLAPSPSCVLVEHDEQRLLLEALRRIPVDHQIVLELYHWEGLSGPALATVLEIPEPTVRSRIRRGTAMLRRQMKEIASSRQVLESTLTNLDGWARSVRERIEPRASTSSATPS